MSKRDRLQKQFGDSLTVNGSIKKVGSEGVEEVPFSNAQFELSADKFQLLGETIEFSEDDIREIDNEKVVFEFKKKNHSVIIEIRV